MVAVRTTGLRVLQIDSELEVMRMLTDRREILTRRRVSVNRLHAMLAELLPGQAKADITTGQAKTLLASVRPRDLAGKTRRRIAVEELTDLIAIEAKIKKATAELQALVLERGSRLMDIHGAGPVVAARILADVGDVTRRISDNVYRQLLDDAQKAGGRDPGGHCGASQISSAVDLPPHIDTSDRSLPGPAKPTLQPTAAHRNIKTEQALPPAS